LILEQKNPERVAAGLKATMHNPTVSEEAKSRAQARLKEMGVDADTKAPSHGKTKESKATDETPSHDLRREEHGGYDMPEEHRILGGYKATLKSSVVDLSRDLFADLFLTDPNVSQEAKEHAKEVLKEHEAI
jgi:hypothetical protein